MDGLSGMKIYQTFIIDSKFLPLNYPTKLQFLIKGISHNIDRDSWTTQIETFSIPKEITSESPQGTSESQAPDTSGTEEEISALVAPKFVLPIKGGQARGDDCAGSGAYGAGRDRAVSAKYPDGKGPHEGYDIKIFEAVSIPVYAPISGKLVSSTPYTNDGPLYVKDRPKNQLNDVNQGFKIKGKEPYIIK